MDMHIYVSLRHKVKFVKAKLLSIFSEFGRLENAIQYEQIDIRLVCKKKKSFLFDGVNWQIVQMQLAFSTVCTLCAFDLFIHTENFFCQYT